MLYRSSIGAIVWAALCFAGAAAHAEGATAIGATQYDPSRYPDWSRPHALDADPRPQTATTRPSRRGVVRKPR